MERIKHPRSILWAPLVPISWILPLVGHVAITDANGVIYDFSGPFTVETGDSMMNGPPLLSLPIDSYISDLEWERALSRISDRFRSRTVGFEYKLLRKLSIEKAQLVHE